LKFEYIKQIIYISYKFIGYRIKLINYESDQSYFP